MPRIAISFVRVAANTALLLIVYGVITLLLASTAMARQQQVSTTPVYVLAQPGECVNTYTVRLMVVASNAGASYGEFDGVRMMLVRKGAGPDRCWLEMGEWNSQGHLLESKRLRCLFANPLEAPM